VRHAQDLYREGRLAEAIASLQAHLRDQPGDQRARSFLFELLCFAGEFDRARKQLLAFAQDSNDSRLGVTFYFAALTAETERQAWYEDGSASEPAPEGDVSGVCNGRPFRGISDLDGRLGGSLEFLAAGKYHRIAFRNLKRIEMSPPTRVRDLYWRTARAETSAQLGSSEIDSMLVPVLYPHSYLFDDDRTRLGRTTDFALSAAGVEIPCGQRILVVGGEQIPLLEIHSLEFDPSPPLTRPRQAVQEAAQEVAPND
jgi:type VI secretion system protein ImpE